MGNNNEFSDYFRQSKNLYKLNKEVVKHKKMNNKNNDFLIISDKFDDYLHSKYDGLYDNFIKRFKNYCNGRDITVNVKDKEDKIVRQKVQCENKFRIIMNCKACMNMTDFIWQLTPGGTDINIIKDIIACGGEVLVNGKVIDDNDLDNLLGFAQN